MRGETFDFVSLATGISPNLSLHQMAAQRRRLAIREPARAAIGELSVWHKIMKPRITIVTLGVADLPRAIQFYRDGLGFPTDAKDDAAIAIFMTRGVRLALYPKKALAEDISAGIKLSRGGFGGITLAHNVDRKEEVAEVLTLGGRQHYAL